MLVDSLISIGLTKKESEVYLILLKFGSTSTGKIIEEGIVSRSKVYDVLERLKQKGFITETIKNKVRYFEATSSERIIDYLKIQRSKIDKQIEEANIMVKEIKKFGKNKNKQEAKIYVGIEGIKSFFSEIIENMKRGEEYLAITLGSLRWNKEMELFFQNFHLKRAEKGVNAKILYSGDKREMHENVNLKHTGLYDFRFIKERVPCGIIIFKSMVATINWKDKPKIFVIINEDNSLQYKKFFYELWKKAKK